MQSSQIELDRKALKNNLDFINNQLKPNVKLSCVLKGNAYGHGIIQMVSELEELNVSHFSLFSSDEAMIAKQASNLQTSEFMIMGAIDDDHLTWIIKNEIQVYVFTKERILKLSERAKKIGKKAKIHLEVETGMNRTGFQKKDWNEILTLIQNDPHLELIGVCTHFAGAESIANYKRIENQRKVFKQAQKTVQLFGFQSVQYHSSCSAALMEYPNEQHDMVRIGILQYGLWPSKETYISYLTKHKLTQDPLKRVISWHSYVMSIKKIGKDEFVGYGMSYLTESEIEIATVPVGYSSGYSRDLSNQGKVLINGQRLDVIGIINMNLLVVDITNCENIKIGQKVTLIGKENDLEISVASFGDYTNKLNYEVLTHLDKGIKRTIK